MKLLAITATLALTVPVLSHDGHHPAIAKLSNLIGGVWSTKMPDGSAIRVTYKWMADGHTILGEGTWTSPNGKVMHTQTLIGMDEEAKKPFYFDTHAGNPVHGHVTLENGKVVFTFGPAGKPAAYIEEGGFPEKDTYTFTMKDIDGKVLATNSLRRTR